MLLSIALAFSIGLVSFGLRICHHNDFHARYTEINKYNSPCSEEDMAALNCFSSLARLQSAMKLAKCDVRVFAGDFVEGSVYDAVFGTEIAVAAYNEIKYDIATFGNHEFDKGVQPIYETVVKTPGITWLSTNVKFTDAPHDFYTRRSFEKHSICWVSALTESTMDVSRPGKSVHISDPVANINDALSGCTQRDNVIAVTHVGYESDIELCKSVAELDLVIGGHSHTDLAPGQYPTKITRTDNSTCWVVTALGYGRYLGMLDISFNKGIFQFSESAYIPLDGRIPLHPDTLALAASFTARLEDSVKRVIGEAAAPIDGSRSSCRTRECQMGNLVCDALLAYAGPHQGAVACVLNGGTLRASIGQGPVTIEQILNVLPFGNVHAVVTLPGSGILGALENGLLAVEDSEITGRFPQVGGMKIQVDYSAPTGRRVKEVVIAGKILDLTKSYTIVTNSFLVSGDGFDWSGATSIELSGRGLDTLLGEYLSENKPYIPFVNGRIERI